MGVADGGLWLDDMSFPHKYCIYSMLPHPQASAKEQIPMQPQTREAKMPVSEPWFVSYFLDCKP